MVNFRFHLVSLIAIFLALGVGIIVGSTVIDQATVQGLERNVDTFRDQRDAARDERDQLEGELGRWEKLDAELPAELLAGRLAGVPVLVVAADGVDPKVAERLHAWFATAGAVDQGTLWLTDKLALENGDDRASLAQLVGTAPGRAEAVQRAALDAIAAALEPPVPEPPGAPPDPAAPTTSTTAIAGGELLARLREAGFLRYDAANDAVADPAAVPRPGTRLVVLSAADAELRNDQFAVPLVALFARQTNTSLVAAEAVTDEEARGAFVGAIRDDEDIRRRVSTVDGVEQGYGQVSLVLAVEDLAGGVIGHYGVAAERMLPQPNR